MDSGPPPPIPSPPISPPPRLHVIFSLTRGWTAQRRALVAGAGDAHRARIEGVAEGVSDEATEATPTVRRTEAGQRDQTKVLRRARAFAEHVSPQVATSVGAPIARSVASRRTTGDAEDRAHERGRGVRQHVAIEDARVGGARARAATRIIRRSARRTSARTRRATSAQRTKATAMTSEGADGCLLDRADGGDDDDRGEGIDPGLDWAGEPVVPEAAAAGEAA